MKKKGKQKKNSYRTMKMAQEKKRKNLNIVDHRKKEERPDIFCKIDST